MGCVFTDDEIDDLSRFVRTRIGDQRVVISDLAAAMKMVPNTMSRKFKITFGDAPMRWLQSVRAQLAKEVITAYPGAPLTEVASVCGFTSNTHLARIFSETFEDDAKQYRHRIRLQLNMRVERDPVIKLSPAMIQKSVGI